MTLTREHALRMAVRQTIPPTVFVALSDPCLYQVASGRDEIAKAWAFCMEDDIRAAFFRLMPSEMG